MGGRKKKGPAKKLPRRRSTEAHSLEQPQYRPRTEHKRRRFEYDMGAPMENGWFDDDYDPR